MLLEVSMISGLLKLWMNFSLLPKTMELLLPSHTQHIIINRSMHVLAMTRLAEI